MSISLCPRNTPFLLGGSFALLLGLFLVAPLDAAPGPRVLPVGELPPDVRLEPLKDLNGYFPFAVPADREAWEKRAETVRTRMRVALGLWPAPEKTPLNAVIHGQRDMGAYTVEKVYFESLPGFHVTGNLYRPKGFEGKRPTVLCPHGHWKDARFYDKGLAQVRRDIVNGEERFEEGGRNPVQARCVQLARMGCVVFHYDMVGYSDSQQISYEVAHRFAKQRLEMNHPERWGLFSPQAESHLQNVMGLQTWNSIRSVDFLETLPDVDPQRLAVTGASGGGTQSFALAALDPRISVAMPAVMVSTAMQGGCTCENAGLLRIRTGNVEFAALFAPKPLGLTAADDWTVEMETKGLPELKRLYALMGAPNNVMLKPLTHFKHNYNYVSRAAMYSWFNKHLRLGLTEPVVEEDFERLTQAELTVYDEAHPQPEGGEDFERQFLQQWNGNVEGRVAEASSSAKAWKDLAGPALEILVGRSRDQVGEVELEGRVKTDRGDWLEMAGLLRNRTHGEALPLTFLHPRDWKGHTVIWLDGLGKAGLFTPQGRPVAAIQGLLSRGVSVLGVDLLFQGEFLPRGEKLTETRRVKNPREFAGYTFGYNDALVARRAQDILSVVRFVRTDARKSKVVSLAAVNGMAPAAVLAAGLAGDWLDAVALDTAGFRFSGVRDLQDPNFLPGGARYGDWPGLLALFAPRPVYLAGEAKLPAILRSVHGPGPQGTGVTLHPPAGPVPPAMATWLGAF